MQPARSIQVLVVDDEPDICDLSKDYMERSIGLRVEIAHSVAEARATLGQKHYDVIVSDYQMPIEDGIQFLKSLRGRGDSIPFILFTGKGREEIVIEALNNGADSYLQKGGKPAPLYAELEHRIRTAVRKHEADAALVLSNLELQRANEELAAAEEEMATQLEEIRAGVDKMAAAREGLQVSEDKFHALLMNLSTGVVVHALDTTIIFSNPMASRLLGLTEDQMRGKAAMDPSWCFLREDGTPLPLAEYPVNRVLSSREPFADMVLGIVRPDREEPTWVLCNAHPNRDRRSVIHNLVVTFTDITERKRAEEALKGSEAKYKLLFNHAGDAIFIHDVEGRMLAVNLQACERLKYTEAELMAMTADQVDTPEQGMDTQDRVARLMEQGLLIFETVHRRKDGSPVPTEVTAQRITWEGRPAIMSICHVITERKRAELTAASKERSLRDMAEEKLTRTPKCSPEPEEQEAVRSIHELQVHQIELELQAQELRRAHSALEESRDKYFDLYENAPIGYLTLTDKGLVMAANLTSATLLGLARSKLINGRFSKYVIEDDSNVWYRHFLKVLKEREKQTCILTLKRGDGSVFPAQIETVWTSDTSTESPKIWMTISNIADIRQAEEKLRTSEEIFRTTIEQSSDGIIIVDEKFRIIEWSSAQTKIFGFTREEMIGCPIWEFQQATLPEEQRTPVTLERMKNIVLASLTQASPSSPLNSEFEAQCKDGSRKTVQVSMFPVTTSGARLHCAIIRDITDAKRMEGMARRAANYARRLIEASPDPLVTINAEGMITDANAATCELTGVPREEIIGTDFSTYFTEPHRAEEGYQQAFTEGEVRDYPLTFIGPSGHKVGVLYNASVYRDEQGRVEGVFAAARDITERKRAEEALSFASRKLNILSSITRHDIINQLLVLTGHLALLERDQRDPSGNEHLHKVKAAAERVSAMIQFTKEYEDIGMQAPAWVSPGRQTAKAFTMLHPPGVELEDNTRGVEIFADPLAEKVPFNLIDNSIRHGEQVTRIKMSAEQRGDAMLIVYQDNGVGISDEDKKRLFEKGFGKNTGFGLFLTREILAITGITITETGKAREGVRFEMLVPAGAWRLPPPPDRPGGRHAKLP